jgi:hypothetical protein
MENEEIKLNNLGIEVSVRFPPDFRFPVPDSLFPEYSVNRE